jgi:hypothetical protein
MPGKSNEEVAMKTGSKLLIALLVALLAVPALGHAKDGAGKKMSSEAAPKPTYTAPSDCKMLPKMTASDAQSHRKKIVSERLAKGETSGSKLIYNKEAAKRHGKHHGRKN